MDQIQFAAHQTAHGAKRGDLGEMAKYLGVGEQVLRNKVNPEQEQAKLSLDEAVRMMRKDGDLRILLAVAAEFGCTVTEPTCPVTSVVSATLAANADHGDVTRAVVDAHADGIITPAELADCRRKIAIAQHALSTLEQTLIDKAAK